MVVLALLLPNLALRLMWHCPDPTRVTLHWELLRDLVIVQSLCVSPLGSGYRTQTFE